MDELLYSNSLDRGTWHLRVWNLRSYPGKGVLQVFNKKHKIVHQEFIPINQGDPINHADVRSWHLTVIEIADGVKKPNAQL